jgi:hypothetical protein
VRPVSPRPWRAPGAVLAAPPARPRPGSLIRHRIPRYDLNRALRTALTAAAALLVGAVILGLVVVLSAVVFYGLAWLALSV